MRYLLSSSFLNSFGTINVQVMAGAWPTFLGICVIKFTLQQCAVTSFVKDRLLSCDTTGARADVLLFGTPQTIRCLARKPSY